MREVIELQFHQDHRTLQGFYILPGRESLRPNATFVRDGRVLFETNSYGLRGPEPDSARKLVVIWGDSVVFGMMSDWVTRLSSVLTSHQALNGGMEGDVTRNIIKRAQIVNDKLPVDVNILFPGWHPMARAVTLNDGFADVLKEGVRTLPGVILVTIPTALNEWILDDSFEEVLKTPSPHGGFVLWGNVEQTLENGRLMYEAIQERNNIIRAVAARENVPVFDWAVELSSAGLEDFREHFFDPGHPRPTAYPLITAQFARALNALAGAELDPDEFAKLPVDRLLLHPVSTLTAGQREHGAVPQPDVPPPDIPERLPKVSSSASADAFYWALGPAALLQRVRLPKRGWQVAREIPQAPPSPLSRVIGLSCYYHDSAVALIEDGKIQFALQEERLSRRKNDPRFPVLALSKALECGGCTLDDIDAIAFYDNPELKYQRIWYQILHDWPHSQQLYAEGAPYFWHHRRPVAEQIRESYAYRGRIQFGEHHRSHAASAFYTSPFERALVVTIDGVGEFETCAVYLGEGNRLHKLKSIHFPHSLGLLYSVVTQYLGFEVNEGEYKVMGLAPYGEPRFLNKILGPLLNLHEDGSFTLKPKFFRFSSRDRHYVDELIHHLGVVPRTSGDPLTQAHRDLAASIQRALELALTNLVGALIAEYQLMDVCFAGGVALNCTANSHLIRELGIRLHIHPAAGDAGGAIGAAMDAVIQSQPRHEIVRFEFQPYLGVAPSPDSTTLAFRLNHVPYRRSCAIAAEIAAKLARGEIVAIVHGRDEWGPRALGGRSILADPRTARMKDHLNAKIKFREEFRPFAPVVLAEHFGEYYETLGMSGSPYMLFTHNALQPDKTAAVTHADNTSRVQTVTREQNPYLYDIVAEFHRLTGVPVIINTSFNLKGEPIVSSVTDALKTFYHSGIDCLAVEDMLVEKEGAS